MDYTVLIDTFRPVAGLFLILTCLVFVGILLDYLTGTLAARGKGEWSSKIAREGIRHKVGIIIGILVGVLLDVVVVVATRGLGWEIPISGLFSLLVCVCYIITELGSVLENLQKMGVAVPAVLLKGFTFLKHSVEARADAAVPEAEEDVTVVGEDDEPPDDPV